VSRPCLQQPLSHVQTRKLAGCGREGGREGGWEGWEGGGQCKGKRRESVREVETSIGSKTRERVRH
jgi:hypothetical protein